MKCCPKILPKITFLLFFVAITGIVTLASIPQIEVKNPSFVKKLANSLKLHTIERLKTAKSPDILSEHNLTPSGKLADRNILTFKETRETGSVSKEQFIQTITILKQRFLFLEDKDIQIKGNWQKQIITVNASNRWPEDIITNLATKSGNFSFREIFSSRARTKQLRA